MPKFKVTFDETHSVTIEVEAENETKAEDIAFTDLYDMGGQAEWEGQGDLAISNIQPIS
jgi:hypothetical protein